MQEGILREQGQDLVGARQPPRDALLGLELHHFLPEQADGAGIGAQVPGDLV